MKKNLLPLAFALATTLSVNAQSEIYPQHFDLEEVTLLDGVFKNAQDLNIKHLLSYDADRLMTPFVRQAGLSKTTDKANPYYQWEQLHPNHENWGSGSFRLDGHVGGHYMTALALAYAATHDASQKAQLLSKIQHILPILQDCQDAYDNDQSGMYGFIGGQPCNDAWKSTYAGKVGNFGYSAVPLYCQHKILAGLRDIALYCDGDEAAKAKAMFRKLCDWHINLVSKLTDSQLQDWLNTEHGGVNETLADAYAMFKDAKYLAAAKRYSHLSMVNGMQTVSATFLDGKHANTQVPKYIGFARIGQEDAAAGKYMTAAKNFWNDVAANRTVCIGGNSVNEHFISATAGNRYMDETNGPESCNSNNMLKLSEDLFDATHDARYADFYEGTMYNHILSTQDPQTGGYVYFTPLRPQSYRIYSKVDQDMWCCVGTGMENHSKYGHFIYTHDGDNKLYVNLFTPSVLENATFGIRQETAFPYAGSTTLTVTKAGNYQIALRHPAWCGEYTVTVNGVKQETAVSQGKASYVTLGKTDWAVGDKIEVGMTASLRYEQCPNMPDYIAFKYGPILLASQTSAEGEELPHEYALGERMGHAPDSYAPKKALSTMPMLIGDRKDVLQRVTPKGGAMQFTIDVSRRDAPAYKWNSLEMKPFYELHHARVNTYFYQATEETYKSSTWAIAEAEAEKLNSRTIDRIDVGQQQAEAGSVTHSDNSSSGTYNDEDYRDTKAGGWIEATLMNNDANAKDLSIILRYTTADKGRKCNIYVNGKLLKAYTVPATKLGADGNGFYNEEIPLGDLAYDGEGGVAKTFVVRICAESGTLNPGLYYIRLMKDYTASDYGYRFNAADWGFTGDAGRMAQSKISVDTETNTITMKQSGDNNICLKYGVSKEYEVALDHKYLVICGTNLNTTSSTAHYLWWLNGANKGTQVAPTTKKTVSDGRVLLAWDITKSNLDANCTADPWVLSTSYNANSTLFGLTAKSSTKEVVISYIGFMTEDEVKNDAVVSVGAIPMSSASDVYYTLNGVRTSNPTSGIFIHVDGDGTAHKELAR